MNRTLMVAVTALAVVSLGAAQTKKTEKTPKTIKCAVMPNDVVNIADATKKKMFADYKGRRYFFCCGGCPPAFKAAPDKYAKGPSIKSPVAPKKKKA
ncbi:MAG: YHS domain-containing protein [Fimbriimonadaceae bacterium]|nr:YHS domain-containing protein [Fimbriimonadaceae bacterium]